MKFVGFYNKATGKRLGAISVRGLTLSEIRPTKQLLAYNNKIRPTNIKIKIVNLKR